MGRRPATVQVGGDRHGQIVGLAHHDLPSAARLDGGTGEDPVVAPDLRLQAGQNLRLADSLRYFVIVDAIIGAHGFEHRGHV